MAEWKDMHKDDPSKYVLLVNEALTAVIEITEMAENGRNAVFAKFYEIGQQTIPDFEGGFKETPQFTKLWQKVLISLDNVAKNEKAVASAKELVSTRWGAQGNAIMKHGDSQEWFKYLGSLARRVRTWGRAAEFIVLAQLTRLEAPPKNTKPSTLASQSALFPSRTDLILAYQYAKDDYNMPPAASERLSKLAVSLRPDGLLMPTTNSSTAAAHAAPQNDIKVVELQALREAVKLPPATAAGATKDAILIQQAEEAEEKEYAELLAKEADEAARSDSDRAAAAEAQQDRRSRQGRSR
ncbi:hypothetical protein BDW74DRAFT_183368 [Aspergillus multicolor]|uniref:uncharacterized protein n=1 Tax=Aspergillus multicolor TaxID=41759 RepID=UPI003CCDDB46